MKKLIALLFSIFTILLVSTCAFAFSGGVNGDGDFTGGGFSGGSRLSSVFGSSPPSSSSLSTMLSYEALNNLTANINLGISLGEIEILNGNIRAVTVTKRTDWNAYVITGVYNGNTYVIVNASGGRYYSPINEGYSVVAIAGVSNYYLTNRPAGTSGNGYLGDLYLTYDNWLNIQSTLNYLTGDKSYYTYGHSINGEFRYYLANRPSTTTYYVCNSAGQLFYTIKDTGSSEDTGGGESIFDPTEIITAINSVYSAINSQGSRLANGISQLTITANSIFDILNLQMNNVVDGFTDVVAVGNNINSTLETFHTTVSRRIDFIIVNTDRLNTTASNMETSLLTSVSHLNSISYGINQIGVDVDKLIADSQIRHETLISYIDGVEVNLSAASSRLGDIYRSLGDVSASLDEMVSNDSTFRETLISYIDAVEVNVISGNSHLANIYRSLGEVSASVSQMVINNGAYHESLVSYIDGVEDYLSTGNSYLSSILSYIVGVDVNVTSISSKLDSVRSDVSDIISPVTQIADAIVQIKDDYLITYGGGGLVEVPFTGDWQQFGDDFDGDGILDDSYYQFYFTSPLNLVVGNTYIVDWNGTEYECIAFDFPLNDDFSFVAIGNSSVIDGEDNGVPFIIYDIDIPEFVEEFGFYGIAGLSKIYGDPVPFAIYSFGMDNLFSQFLDRVFSGLESTITSQHEDIVGFWALLLDGLGSWNDAQLTALSNIYDRLGDIEDAVVSADKVIIDITTDNDAFNIFYITKTDGTTESVGYAAKDAAVFIGDVLSMFYRLVFDDALDNTGIIKDFEDTLTSTNSGVNVW